MATRGAQSAGMPGGKQMLLWPADSWDYQAHVILLVKERSSVLSLHGSYKCLLIVDGSGL